MPRAGLTALRVTQEAEVVADEGGLDVLTLSAVAQRLGVQLPSLYKHVGGVRQLVRLIAVRAKTELADVLARAAAGRSGEDAAVSMGVAYREWAREHPGRYAATLRAPDADDTEDAEASDAVLRIVLSGLSAFGLVGNDAVSAVRAFRATLHGFVSLELAGGFGLPVDVEATFAQLLRSLAVMLRDWSGASAPAVGPPPWERAR